MEARPQFSSSTISANIEGAEFLRCCFCLGRRYNREHSGTSRNIPEHRIIMIIMKKIRKINFSMTEKTCNLEAAMIKLHKCYHFMILLWNGIKIFAVAKLRQPVEVLKSLNDRQSHILLKFKEPKEPIQFKLSYLD